MSNCPFCLKQFTEARPFRIHLVLSHNKWYPPSQGRKFIPDESGREATAEELEEAKRASSHRALSGKIKSPRLMSPRPAKATMARGGSGFLSSRQPNEEDDMDLDGPQEQMRIVVARLRASAVENIVLPPEPDSPIEVGECRMRKNPLPRKVDVRRQTETPRRFSPQPLETDHAAEKRKQASARRREADLAANVLPFSEEESLRQDLEAMQQEVVKNPLLLGKELPSEKTLAGGLSSARTSGCYIRAGKTSLISTKSTVPMKTHSVSEEVLFAPDSIVPSSVAKGSVSARGGRSKAPCTVSRAPVSTEHEVESGNVRGSIGSKEKLNSKEKGAKETTRGEKDKVPGNSVPANPSLTNSGRLKDIGSTAVRTPTVTLVREPIGSRGRGTAVRTIPPTLGRKVCLDEEPGFWKVSFSESVISYVLETKDPWVVAEMTQHLQKELFPVRETGWIYSIVLHTVMTYQKLLLLNKRLISKADRPCGSTVLFHGFVEAIGGAEDDPFGGITRFDLAPGSWPQGESRRIISAVLRHPSSRAASQITVDLMTSMPTDLPRGHVFGLVRHTIDSLKTLVSKSQHRIPPKSADDTYVLHKDLQVIIGDAVMDAVITESE